MEFPRRWRNSFSSGSSKPFSNKHFYVNTVAVFRSRYATSQGFVERDVALLSFRRKQLNICISPIVKASFIKQICNYACVPSLYSFLILKTESFTNANITWRVSVRNGRKLGGVILRISARCRTARCETLWRDKVLFKGGNEKILIYATCSSNEQNVF